MFSQVRVSRGNLIQAKPQRRTSLSFGTMALALIAITSAGLLLEQASAAGPQCTPPYVQVQDAAPAFFPDPTNQFSIQYVAIGEPFVNCTTKRLVIVLKVPTMDPENNGSAMVPPSGIWRVWFNIPGTANSTGSPQKIFFQLDSSGPRATSPAFAYGWSDTVDGFDFTYFTAPPGSVTVSPDGTITMNLNIGNTITYPTTTGDTVGTWTIPPSAWQGLTITQIQGETDRVIGGVVLVQPVVDAQTTGDGQYTLQGNLSCSAAPVAALAAAPTSGNAPLLVNFDASGSNIPAGGCGTINSYIFDFGDGSPQVTQSTPTISHTYTIGGVTYPARVRVTSTSGLTSSNIAQQNIMVNSAQPPALTSVVSRATHSTAGDFDVSLSIPPATPRGVECRSLGGNYKMVFTFLNNLISVTAPTVTTGTAGSVMGALGPDSNQYTVNLTGVSNQQYIGVTLIGVHDFGGAVGNEPEIQMGVLIGDVNANGLVNSTDASQVQAQSGQAVTGSNFRMDLNANGLINSTDASIARQQSGTGLPSSP